MRSKSRIQIFIELEEFCFMELAVNLSEFHPSINFKKRAAGTETETKVEGEDVDARRRIAILEEKANQHDHNIAMLQNKVTQLSTDFGRLGGET
jgi:hypothetical protein